MRDSNNDADVSKPRSSRPALVYRVPDDLNDRFVEASSRFEAFTLRAICRELRGRSVEVDDAAVAALAQAIDFDVDEIAALVTTYNECIAEYGASRALRRGYSPGRRIETQLKSFTGVLPSSVALRWPSRLSGRWNGALEYDDKYGTVTTNATPRVQTLGLLAALGGIATSLGRYSALGMTDAAGRIYTSHNKLWYILTGHPTAGGAGVACVAQWLNTLRDLTFDATVAKQRDGARVLSATFANVVTIEKLSERGEWVDYRDPSPTSRSHESPLRISLSDEYLAQIAPHENRVFLNMRTWRRADDFTRRLYAFLQGSRTNAEGEIQFFAAPELCAQLGIERPRRYNEVRDTIERSLAWLQISDNRYKPGYARPWRFGQFLYWNFKLRVKGKSSPRDDRRITETSDTLSAFRNARRSPSTIYRGDAFAAPP